MIWMTTNNLRFPSSSLRIREQRTRITNSCVTVRTARMNDLLTAWQTLLDNLDDPIRTSTC